MKLLTEVESREELVEQLWGQGKRNFRALERLIAKDYSEPVSDSLRRYLEERGYDIDPFNGEWNNTSLNDYIWFNIDEILEYFGLSEDDFCKALNNLDILNN